MGGHMGARDLAQAEAEYPGWLGRLLTHPVEGEGGGTTLRSGIATTPGPGRPSFWLTSGEWFDTLMSEVMAMERITEIEQLGLVIRTFYKIGKQMFGKVPNWLPDLCQQVRQGLPACAPGVLLT